MAPFKHTCLKFLVTEAFCASGVAIGMALVNEEPGIPGLETPTAPGARRAEG